MKDLFVYITAADITEARSIGRIILENRLAGCINILPGMESMYWWEGEMEKAEEVVLIAKTQAIYLDELTALVKKHHSYACPCVVAIPVGPGNPDYFEWLEDNLRKKR